MVNREVLSKWTWISGHFIAFIDESTKVLASFGMKSEILPYLLGVNNGI